MVACEKFSVVDVAQLVRVPDCDSGCRGFESHHPPHFLYNERLCAWVMFDTRPTPFALFRERERGVIVPPAGATL